MFMRRAERSQQIRGWSRKDWFMQRQYDDRRASPRASPTMVWLESPALATYARAVRTHRPGLSVAVAWPRSATVAGEISSSAESQCATTQPSYEAVAEGRATASTATTLSVRPRRHHCCAIGDESIQPKAVPVQSVYAQYNYRSTGDGFAVAIDGKSFHRLERVLKVVSEVVALLVQSLRIGVSACLQ